MNAQIIFSEDIEQQQSGANSLLKVINPILLVGVPFLPTNFSFSVVAIASGYEFQNKNDIEIIIENPKGEILYSTGQQTIQSLPDTDNLNFNLDLKNIILEEAGSYTGKFMWNGDVIASNELTVKEKSRQ